MSERALRSLEQLRSARVEQAKRELSVAQEAQGRAAELLQQAGRVLYDQVRGQPLGQIRSPRDLVWLERIERARLLSARQCEQRFLAAQRTHRAASELVQAAQAELLRLELERRAAAHVHRQLAAEVARVAELRCEEEESDARLSGRLPTVGQVLAKSC